MEVIDVALGLSALLCSLVGGLVFTFAIVVMPGIRSMDDRAFLQSFKAMDRVIQDSQPVFILAWPGSAVVLLGSTVLGMWQLEGLDRVLLTVACVIYLFGVHLPTITINIPLNNQLQSMDLDSMSAPALQEIRARFEGRWLRWNYMRTVVATLTTTVLLVLLIRV